MMKPFPYNPVGPGIVDALKGICGEAFVLFDDEKQLEKYSRDKVPENKYAHFPEVVVKPKTAEEIGDIVKLANREKIPITPRAYETRFDSTEPHQAPRCRDSRRPRSRKARTQPIFPCLTVTATASRRHYR